MADQEVVQATTYVWMRNREAPLCTKDLSG